MLKTKVTCWFCSQDSQVFVFNKNSWTCAHCEQYNGFNKDGDYNKVIPEMHKENKSIKFCTSGSPPRSSNSSSCSTNSSSNSNSLLCDKCNQNQELKLTELNKFESKYDEKSDKFEREYKLYKKKLDHVYDLCKPCKMRLDNHLRSIDQQIGDAYYVRNRQASTAVVASAIMNGAASLTSLNNATSKAATNHVKPVENSTNNNSNNTTNKQISKRGVADETAANGFSICDNLKTTFQKAYTIAGTVPAYVFNSNGNVANGSPASNKLRYRKHEIAPATTNDLSTCDYDANVTNSSRSKRSPAEISATSTRFSCDSLLIVFEDLFALLFILMVCACDIVNLINDSGVLLIEKNSSNEWYNSLLEIYKQVNLMLMFANVLAAHLFYKRPKLSRLLMFLGLAFDLLIHSQLAFDLKTEEQFISEVFISVFLAAYLVFARSYNVLQLIGIV